MKRVRYKNIVVIDTKRTSIILALFLAKWKKKKSLTDSYQQHWMQWASSEPGPPGLLALLRILPCARSWNTHKKHTHTHTCTRILKTTNMFFQVLCRIVWPSRRHPCIWLHVTKIQALVYPMFSSPCVDGAANTLPSYVQIRIKVFMLLFTNILWIIMDYRWPFLHFHTHSVVFQHPPLDWRTPHSLGC